MASQTARIDIRDVEVAAVAGRVTVKCALINTGNSPILVPKRFTSPDPYLIDLRNARGDRVTQNRQSHAFSFSALHEASQSLAPGEAVLFSFNLATFFLLLDPGQYQLSVTLAMGPYLGTLCTRTLPSDEIHDLTVNPSAAVSFFLPQRIATLEWLALEAAKVTYLKRSLFSWRRPVSWYPAMKYWFIRHTSRTPFHDVMPPTATHGQDGR